MLILDRFEGDFALIEVTDENDNITSIEIPKNRIASDAREGDILILNNDIYVTDTDATLLRRKRIINRLRRLRNE